MDRKVTVLTPNGRRHTVNVSQNTTLLQILETTCEKYGYDSDEYCLKHHNKEIGLTQMFRFSGLPNNCLLEMDKLERKRVMKNVDICLQLQDGTRLQAQFDPNKNLLEVIENLSMDALNACASPVILYMRQEIIGKEQMVATTLKSLGITDGRAMLRLMDKTPDQLNKQANVYIAPTPKEKPKIDDDDDNKSRSSKDKSAGSSGGGGFAITPDLVRSLKKTDDLSETADNEADIENEGNSSTEPKEPEKPKYDWGTGAGHAIGGTQALDESRKNLNDLNEEEIEIEPEYKILGERNALIYSLDDVKKDDEELPDSFYDLTVHDLKLVLRDLKKIAAGHEDEPLLTEKLRELEQSKQMLNKIATYKNCVVRVQFPNRYVLQGMFKPTDTISNVQEWIKIFISGTQQQQFHLYTIPPKKILPLDKTLLELDFVPNAIVHFAFDDDTSTDKSKAAEEVTFLNAKYLTELTSPEGALYAAKKFRKMNEKSVALLREDAPSTSHAQSSTGAIPKRPRNQET